MAKQTMADQSLANLDSRTSTFGTPTNQPAFGRGTGLGKGGAARHRRLLPDSPPLLTFLTNPSVILPNLVPDQQTGEVKIPVAELKEGNYLQIFVMDGTQAIQVSFVVEKAKVDYQKRDLRFKSPLDHTKHYIGERIGISLDPQSSPSANGNETTVMKSLTLSANASSSSSVKVINSVGQVYDLMMTLLDSEQEKQNLRKFGFIVDWYRFSTLTKNEKFSKWNCHELNLFLYKKDRPYFDAVVAPFIKVVPQRVWFKRSTYAVLLTTTIPSLTHRTNFSSHSWMTT